LKFHEEALKLRRSKLGDDNPETLQSMNNVAFMYSSVGRHAEALKLYEESVALLSKLRANHPLTLQSMNDLAWIFANCPDQKLRNPGKAIELAQKAVEGAPDKGDFWNTLGGACYRKEDCKGAIRALEKSI